MTHAIPENVTLTTAIAGSVQARLEIRVIVINLPTVLVMTSVCLNFVTLTTLPVVVASVTRPKLV